MNQDHDSFLDVIRSFLKEANLSKPPVSACFAVAGPVSNNSVTFTNRANWSIEGDVLAKQLGIRKVRLINDFLAVGMPFDLLKFIEPIGNNFYPLLLHAGFVSRVWIADS